MDNCPLTPDDLLVGLGLLGIITLCLSVIMQIVQGIITFQIFKKLMEKRDADRGKLYKAES